MIYIDSTSAFRQAWLLVLELGQDLTGRILSLCDGAAFRATNLDWMVVLSSHGFTLVPSWVVVCPRIWYFLKGAMICANTWMACSMIYITLLSPSSCLGLLCEYNSPWQFVLWLGQKLVIACPYTTGLIYVHHLTLACLVGDPTLLQMLHWSVFMWLLQASTWVLWQTQIHVITAWQRLLAWLFDRASWQGTLLNGIRVIRAILLVSHLIGGWESANILIVFESRIVYRWCTRVHLWVRILTSTCHSR